MASAGFRYENERPLPGVSSQPARETAHEAGEPIHRRGMAGVPAWTPHGAPPTAGPAQAPRAAGPPLIDYRDYESLLRLARAPNPERISPLRPDEPTTPLVYVFGPITDSQVAIGSQGNVTQNQTGARPEQLYRTHFQPARRADPVQVVETLRVEVDRLGLDLYSQYVIRQAAAVIKVELARPPIDEERVRGAVEQILACLARQLGGAPLTARLAALAARLKAVFGSATEGNSASGDIR
ncbi:hypothetical protein [Streptomyces mirabilis]|uniref:GIY-YIG nuclease family protein n=1 Tax=Streptomyces mirabilis TaxID=68239 RepID=A0ABU3UDV9_9ACTN|nr:hypothetical protein [Streptomyces mirabilis]MDU8992104.1 hypothetical protein [Streptomyces mirabilis]